MSPLEIIAVLCGLANILLLILRRILNYPFGIAMVILYAWIFWHAKLYSDALLQVFFLIIQIFGWVQWSRGRTADGAVEVLNSSRKDLLLAIAVTLLGAALLGAAMHRWTDASFPFWDALVASISVVAQVLLSLRRIENWHWWIVADIVATTLYFRKGLNLTAGLYALFLIMAAVGLASWRRQLVPRTIPKAPDPAPI